MFNEFLFTYNLIFGSTGHSRAKKLSVKAGISEEALQEWYRDLYAQRLRLDDFPFYGNGLQEVQAKMQDWKHHGVRDIFVLPYKNLLEYYALWMAILFGMLSLLSLGLGAAQTYATFKAL
jgi:hypothetical protein